MTKHFLSLILVLSVTLSTQAQDFPYFFSVQNATYTELSDDKLLTSPVDTWDDPFFKAPLGFDFTLLGFTSDSIFNNEYLGAGISMFERNDDNYYDPISIFFPFGNDLIDRGEINGIPDSPVSYATEGEAGSQIFKLQYKNAGFFAEGDSLETLDNSINLQVWLYEGSNDIEIHFGPSDLPNDLNGIDDYSGPFIAFIDSLEEYNFTAAWTLVGDAASPSVNALTPAQIDTFFYTLNSHPANGTVYRFGTSPNVGVEELVHAESFKLYPSLVEDLVQMEVSNQDWIGQEANYQLIDGQGRVVLSFQNILEANRALDLSGLAPGMYFFTLSTAEARLSRRLIKQ